MVNSKISANGVDNFGNLMMYSDTNVPNDIKFLTTDEFITTLTSTASLSDNQVIMLPDKSGTIALLSDITTSSGSVSFDTSSMHVLSADSASFATTGSNTFNGDQIINGNISVSSAHIGSSTDYVNIDTNGNFTLIGSASYWDDVMSPGMSLKTGGDAPDFSVFTDGLYVYKFKKGDQAFGSVQIPHKYKEGSDIYPHIHFSPDSTNTGDVNWLLEYTWANINNTFSASTTITGSLAASGSIHAHQLCPLPVMNGSDKTLSSQLVFRVARTNDSNDTFTGNAFLHQIDWHIEADSLGSKQEYIK